MFLVSFLASHWGPWRGRTWPGWQTAGLYIFYHCLCLWQPQCNIYFTKLWFADLVFCWFDITSFWLLQSFIFLYFPIINFHLLGWIFSIYIYRLEDLVVLGGLKSVPTSTMNLLRLDLFRFNLTNNLLDKTERQF